jgi:prepilin-type N-terminal cleavage/methylation domain-containing protein
MKGARTPAGYTIIEVMIVLAISGVMFLIAANFITGKQEATSFPQGVNQLAASLQNTLEQVNDGQYSDLDITCKFNNATPPTASSISGLNLYDGTGTTTNGSAGVNDTQGTLSPCIFLGKVVQFNFNDGVSGDIPAQQYQTFTLAGGRLDANSQPITQLDYAGPTPIPQLTIQASIPQHLNVIDVNEEPTTEEPASSTAPFPSGHSSNPSFGIGFIQSLGTTDQNGAANGSQPINLYYVSGLGADLAAPIIDGTTLTLVPPTQEVVMCVTDNAQYAYIEIGSDNNQLAVRVRMLGYQPLTFGNNQCTT